MNKAEEKLLIDLDGCHTNAEILDVVNGYAQQIVVDYVFDGYPKTPIICDGEKKTRERITKHFNEWYTNHQNKER